MKDYVKNVSFYMSIFYFLGGYIEKFILEFFFGKK